MIVLLPLGIELVLGTRVKSADVRRKTLLTATGETITYKILIVATGARVSNLSLDSSAVAPYFVTFFMHQDIRVVSSSDGLNKLGRMQLQVTGFGSSTFDAEHKVICNKL